MAGKNLTLRPGQVLFKKGDQSDGMYLIRNGELLVYLDDGGKEIGLAAVSNGGMIGEMALFDKQPRSASVKATAPSEVTLISNDDFAKLMKQIPKWFVGLMGTLSTRLRDTNNRLQKLEGAAPKKNFQGTLRVLNILSLLFYKDGTKEGQAWHLELETAQQAISEMLSDETIVLKNLIQVLVKHQIVLAEKNRYNRPVLVLKDRAQVERFAQFFAKYLKQNSANPVPSPAAMDMMKTIVKLVEESSYESTILPLDELVSEGQKQFYETTDTWKQEFAFFKNLGEDITVVKTSSNSLGLRANKKMIKSLLRYLEVVTDLQKNGCNV